jgi:hypothetical protein
MATGSTYKDEVQPFATGSKIESSIVFFFIWEKFFSLKARPLPKTTTSIPMVSTGCKFEWFSLDSD